MNEKPTSPPKGQTWYNPETKEINCYNGNHWNATPIIYRIAEFAKTFAEIHIGDTDDLGEYARELYALIETLSAETGIEISAIDD